MLIAWLFVVAILTPAVDVSAVLESAYASQDLELNPDPDSTEWNTAPRVVVAVDRSGQPVPGLPTEIRSRWTKQHLYLLYVCPYTELNLKPKPTPTVETPQLWNWDVAEAFIGSDFEHIGRYKEFQVSPQGEWVDLAIDRDDQKSQEGMKWNSGYTVRSHIDARAKTWYGLMRIPFQSIDVHPPEAGRELRIGLFRIAGANPRQRYAWRPTGADTFHVPQTFGTLRLR
jgi:hypothetical protein